MTAENEALTRVLFEGWDGIWAAVHGLLDKAGASPEVHEQASDWMKAVLVPWMDQRKDALLRELARDMISLERTIARIDKVLAGT